jgi:nucleoredoxin
MEAILGSNLHSKQGPVNTSRLNEAGAVLFYFSASWCPPCRQFTPVLATLYEQSNTSGKQFEVVYISWDQTEAQFNDYFGHMPWLAVPFNNKPVRDALYQSFGVNGVPSLILVNKAGQPVNRDGRKDATTLGPRAVEKWIRESS